MRLARVSTGLALTALAATLLLGCFGRIEPAGDSQSRALAAAGDDTGSPRSPAPSPGPTAFLGLGYPPDTLANDADYIYWSELNSVFRASKASPVREKLFGDGTASTGSIAVDDAFVYGIDWIRGSLLAYAKASGALETILPEGSGARVIAQDADSLYVGMQKGGGIRVFAKGQHASVTTLRAGASVLQLAVSGKTIFSVEGDFSSADTVSIVRSTTSGAGGEVMAVVSSPPYQLVAANDVAYWTDDHGLRSTSATAPLYVAAAGATLAAGLSVIGGDAFVMEQPPADGGNATLMRVPLAGGATSIVATLTMDSPPDVLRAFGVRETNDASSIYVSTYWTDPRTAARGDAIVRVPVR
jgi:hypothetical protein